MDALFEIKISLKFFKSKYQQYLVFVDTGILNVHMYTYYVHTLSLAKENKVNLMR